MNRGGEPKNEGLAKRDYDSYITSLRWARRRAKYFKTHQKKCAACGGKKNIELHHHSYAHLGNELDSELTALCRWCHAHVHQLHKKNRWTLEQTTKNYVSRYVRRPKARKPKKKAPPKPVGKKTTQLDQEHYFSRGGRTRRTDNGL